MIRACRDPLCAPLAAPAHAGALLSYYLQQTDDKQVAKHRLLSQSIEAVRRARPIYELAFRRWREHTQAALDTHLSVRGRLIVGLGTKSVLETGITLHHTYGTPLIPGAALKGLAAHYCDQIWGPKQPEFLRSGACYQELFGTGDDAGHILFHDAWITPESLTARHQGLLLDAIVPHHTAYYMAPHGDLKEPPTDYDDPTPVPFLSVAGEFRVAVRCDGAGEDRRKWEALVLHLLTAALADWGIGSKTNAGYGRLRPL